MMMMTHIVRRRDSMTGLFHPRARLDFDHGVQNRENHLWDDDEHPAPRRRCFSPPEENPYSWLEPRRREREEDRRASE